MGLMGAGEIIFIPPGSRLCEAKRFKALGVVDGVNRTFEL